MALTATTLSAAITANQTVFTVVSGTNIIAPNFTAVPAGTTTANILYALVEQELMQITGVNSTTLTVQRGYNGSLAVGHGANAPILTGYSSDFIGFVPSQKANQPYLPVSVAFGAPVTGATITPSAAFCHFTGTVELETINLPNYVNLGGSYPGFYPENPIAGCQVNLVFDGSSAGLTWGTSGNIGVAGTLAAAKNMVTFTYDPNTSTWYPNRIA